MEELFTVQEVAIMLKLSTSTLYRYVETGKMRHKKIGRNIRFTNSHIQGFMSLLNSKGDGDDFSPSVF
jgi:excisionase family DNA binding protein